MYRRNSSNRFLFYCCTGLFPFICSCRRHLLRVFLNNACRFRFLRHIMYDRFIRFRLFGCYRCCNSNRFLRRHRDPTGF